MKKITYISLLLGIPMVYACNSHTVGSKTVATDAIPVKIMALKQQAGNEAIAVSGQFTTDNEVMLSFRTGGIISNLNVKEGDAVHRGQLLAALNPTEINAQLQQAKLANEKAIRDYQRVQNLYKDSVATLEQLQNGKTALQQAEQQLNLVSFNKVYSEIHAPENGYVLKKLANAGQQVSPGMAVLELNGTQAGKWLLRVGISDQEWAAIHIGDLAQVKTTAVPGQAFTGVVSRKSEGVDAASGTFTADITLTGKRPETIAAGMFGQATILKAAHDQGSQNWQIPYEALLDGDGSNGYVFITNDRKTAHKVKVTVGTIDKNTVTITDGLQTAKELIISGSAYLTDNSAITIHQPLNPAQ